MDVCVVKYIDKKKCEMFYGHKFLLIVCMFVWNVGCVDKWTLQNDGFTVMTDCWVFSSIPM